MAGENEVRKSSYAFIMLESDGDILSFTENQWLFGKVCGKISLNI